MFLNKIREEIKEFDSIKIKFRYPTISDEILIEARKNTLTRGQYPTLSLSIIASQQKALALVDAIATLSICSTFLDEKENYIWENFIDPDGEEFILKVYNEFNNWRSSFRNKLEKDSGG